MGTLSHFKAIYNEAFEHCKPEIIVNILKVYSVFCGIMLVMAMYAFVYRILTDFEF